MKTLLIVLGAIVSVCVLEIGMLYLWHKFCTGANGKKHIKKYDGYRGENKGGNE